MAKNNGHLRFPTVNADKTTAYTYNASTAAGTYQLEGRDNYTVDTENMGTITIDPSAGETEMDIRKCRYS